MHHKNIGVLRGAFSFRARVAGLFAWKQMSSADGILMLAPCRSIHTCGMKHAIDVAFINRYGEVLKVVTSLEPYSHVSCRGACAVYERFSCSDTWFSEGDQLVIGIDSTNTQ